MIEAIVKTWTEAQLQTWVKNTAEAVGAYHYHTHDSRKSESDFPDSAIVLPPRSIVAELKKVGGMPTEGQLRVLSLYEGCPGVEAYLWDPMDLREIEEVLGIDKGRMVEPVLRAGLSCEVCGSYFGSLSARSRVCSTACKAALWTKAGGRNRGRERPGKQQRTRRKAGA